MRQKTTIKDIARECGVSLSTVSLVLNGNTRISASTRKKVLEAVKRNDYQPNALARCLASKSSRAIAVVLPDQIPLFSDVHLGEILSGIYERAASSGYKVILEVANERFVGKKEHLRMLDSHQVDGVLVLGACTRDGVLHHGDDTPRRILLVNAPSSTSRLASVNVDYAAAGRAAADHLLSLNHRRIGLIPGQGTEAAAVFHAAFTGCCRAAGVKPTEAPAKHADNVEASGKGAAADLIRKHPDLTALACGHDLLALGALRYLQEAGHRVPGEVSVLGMGDLPFTRTSNPPMTTIALNLYALGQRAMESLLMPSQNHQALAREILPVQLVARSSTGPAPLR